MRKKGGGKQKGGAFERRCCKELSLWMSSGARDDLFWRSAMSGGRASVQFKQGKQNLTQQGDISAIDPLGAPLTDKFAVECKHYKSLSLQTLFSSAKGGLSGFWQQSKQQAARCNKNPLLIAKSGTLHLVGLTMKGAVLLQGTECCFAYFSRLDLLLIHYKDFLKYVAPPKAARRPLILTK